MITQPDHNGPPPPAVPHGAAAAAPGPASDAAGDRASANLLDLSPGELTDWLSARAIAPFRAGQILKWVHGRQTDDFLAMTDLKKPIRTLLAENFSIHRLEKARVQASADGTRKFLFRLADGRLIETVLIPEKDHQTLCVSTQAGCAQGCRFCMTAAGGFQRNLSAGEIIAQARDVSHELGPAPETRLTNIVFMGMGEPLANYDNLIRAISALTDTFRGLGFSTRRVTVSTAGIVPRMADLGRDADVSLAVSLNATENATRDRLMPINRTWPLERLLAACQAFPLKPRRRITFEYILIQGVNDTPDDARRLVRLLRPIRCKINLIPFNPHPASDFSRPTDAAVAGFQKILQDADYTVMIRQSRGQDIDAACGQLRGRLDAPSP